MPIERYYSARAMGELLGVSHWTVLAWITRKKLLRAKKIGKAWRVAESDLQAFIDRADS